MELKFKLKVVIWEAGDMARQKKLLLGCLHPTLEHLGYSLILPQIRPSAKCALWDAADGGSCTW